MTTKRNKLLSLVLMGGIALSAVMLARGAEGEPAKAAEPTSPPAPSDPTQPSLLLQEVLRGSGPAGPQKAPPPKIPNITVKAKVVAADKPAVAMLSIEGTYYTVQEGVELAFASGTHGTISMTVTKLDRNEIQIKLAPLDQTLILR